MRAPYNTTCDLIYGPSGLVPFTVYASGNCRLIPESIQAIQIAPLNLRYGYITLDFAMPNQASVSNVGDIFTTDYSFADLIAIPTGNSFNFRVLWVEIVTYLSHAPYFRAQVQNLAPIFPVTLCNGCVSSPLQWQVSWSGSGFANPFNSGFKTLTWTPGTAPDCQWLWGDPFTDFMTLTYPAVAPNIFDAGGVGAGPHQTYAPSGPWNCHGPNIVTQTSVNPLYPANVTLTPI